MSNKQDKENIKKLVQRSWVFFILALLVTLGLQFVIHPHDKFPVANLPFFYAWFGFSACVGIIIASKFLGVFLKRSENYYSDVKRGKDV